MNLYRRKGKGVGGGNEWECNNCYLLFENLNVLNFYILFYVVEDVDLERVEQYVIIINESVMYGFGLNYVQVDKRVLVCFVC